MVRAGPFQLHRDAMMRFRLWPGSVFPNPAMLGAAPGASQGAGAPSFQAQGSQKQQEPPGQSGEQVEEGSGSFLSPEWKEA